MGRRGAIPPSTNAAGLNVVFGPPAQDDLWRPVDPIAAGLRKLAATC
jgi:hypothetical protein